MINKPFERKNVRPLREALGWTQAQLSQYLGSAPSFTVPSWENPKNADKKIRGVYAEKLWKLANKHGIKF